MVTLKKLLTFLLCIAIIASMPFVFSACKNSNKPKITLIYNNVTYYIGRITYESDTENHYPDELKAWGDYYYRAGRVKEYDEKGEPITVQFIATEVNGVPVLGTDYSLFMNQDAGKCESLVLEKLYIPGTIVSFSTPYLKNTKVSCYYCGKPNILTYNKDSEKYKIYVPNQMYSDYVELLPKDVSAETFLYKANISYKLNVQELPEQYQTEYYYVDYVEYGKSIENIPPEPTLSGYKFGGWYIEPDCINQWDFTNTVPQPAEGEDFNELCLYAKWIKN